FLLTVAVKLPTFSEHVDDDLNDVEVRELAVLFQITQQILLVFTHLQLILSRIIKYQEHNLFTGAVVFEKALFANAALN
ncbi:hypothetical protein AF383_24495, partial [Salmonella enterica subsp. enterica serovar Typhimurium]